MKPLRNFLKSLGKEDLTGSLEISEKRQQEITELLNATHTILKFGDFTRVAHEIFQSCKRSIGAQAGYVALMSVDGKENELLFLDDGGLPCSVDNDLPMPIRGLRAEAYKTGKVVYDNDFMKSKWAKFMPEGHVDLPNVLFAPLIIQEKAVGVLGLSNKNGDFTQHDANLAGAFAEYAAIALQNSKTLEQLEKRAKELEELSATKDKLFSIIGHDLKNPIGNIINVLNLIEDKFNSYSDEKKRNLIKLSIDSATSIADLLENLLQWSYSQREQIKIKYSIINIYEIVSNCIEILQNTALHKGIELKNNIPLSAKAFADCEMATTVIRNLISNAIKFTNEKGKVTVSSSYNNNDIIIEIKDNGIGMDKKTINHLFLIGDTSNINTGTFGEKGTGLGLIICKEFVEKNNGKIWVESIPNKGSSFFISLPKTKNHE